MPSPARVPDGVWERSLARAGAVLMVVAVVPALIQTGVGAREIVGLALLAGGGVVDWRFRCHAGVPAAIAGVVVLGLGRPSSPAWAILVVVLASVGADHGVRAVAAPAAVSVGILCVEFAVQGDWGWLTWALGCVMAASGGVVVHHYRALVQQLRAAQVELATAAAAEERRRIAREVHDVIAHSLAAVMLHITGARLAIEHEPDEAARALGEAERLGRDAMRDLRQTVGLLSGVEDGRASPQPGLDALHSLVAEYRHRRMAVDLEIDGSLAAVPPTVGLTAYRIVQESLANAARHAPGAPVVVEVRVGPAVAVCVTNGAPTGAPLAPGTGLGVVGMHDRARLVGGRVQAGPWRDGWRVEAILPVSAVAA